MVAGCKLWIRASAMLPCCAWLPRCSAAHRAFPNAGAEHFLQLRDTRRLRLLLLVRHVAAATYCREVRRLYGLQE